MPHLCTNCGRTFPDGSKEMLSGCPECGGNKFQFVPEGASETADRDGTPEASEPHEPTGSDPQKPDDSVTRRVSRAATSVRDYVATKRTEPGPPTESLDDNELHDFEETKPSETSQREAESPSDTSEPTLDERGDDVDGPPAGFDEDAEITDSDTSEEDTAQASARSAMADEFDLADTGTTAEDSDAEPTEKGQQPADPSESARPPADGQVVREPVSEKPSDLESLRAELQDQFESIRIVEPGQYELNLMELFDRNLHVIALQEDGKYVIDVPEQWSERPEDDSN